MTNILLFAIILILIAFIYLREEQVKKERAELLDRIMSRTYEEYKEHSEETPSYEPVIVSEQDEYWREIEEKKV